MLQNKVSFFGLILKHRRFLFTVHVILLTMANRKLERLGIDPVMCGKLTQGNITTVRELLTASPLVVMLLTGVGMKEVNDLLAMVSAKVSSQPQNGLMAMHARLQKKRHLSCGVTKFDEKMKGGLLIGTISEICGAPGAGKTQFCMSCTLQAVHSTVSTTPRSSSGGVIYIDTELKFDPNRLIQMAIERYPEQYSSEFRTDAPHQVDALLERIKVSYEQRQLPLQQLRNYNISVRLSIITSVVLVVSAPKVKRPTSMRELQEELGQLQSTVIAQGISLVRTNHGRFDGIMLANIRLLALLKFLLE